MGTRILTLKTPDGVFCYDWGMNNVLLVIDQQKQHTGVSAEGRADYRVRHAARAVLKDEHGKVGVMYAGQRQYYKLPGGGIDEGEKVDEALARELLEETGCTAEITGEIGVVEEWRDHEGLHQISYAFSATKKEQISPPAFTQSELDEGFEVRWVADIEEAIRLVEEKVSHDDINVQFMVERDAAILRAVVE
jgi:8-oxo-dGTP diphosphatase